MFAGYALTFLIPKFYGLTDKYASLFIFCVCGILFFNNVNWITLIKSKDKDIWILAGVIVLTGINLIIIGSNKGAFFVATDFVLIWYLSDKIVMSQKQIMRMAFLYALLLGCWFFLAYPVFFADYEAMAYNTNNAATFTVYTLLCAFVFLKKLSLRWEIMGLLIVTALVRTFHLVVWHRARGAFIMLLMFLLLYYVVPRKWWDSKKLYKAFVLVATLGSLLFVAGYTIIGQTGVNFKLPFFYKNIFSGRQKIWLEIGKLFVKMPITGVGSGYALDSFIEYNLHNAMFDLLAVHGVLVFIGIMYFVWKRLHMFRKDINKNTLALCALCIILAVFIESFFDIDLIWADYAPNLIFLLAIVNSGRVVGRDINPAHAILDCEKAE